MWKKKFFMVIALSITLASLTPTDVAAEPSYRKSEGRPIPRQNNQSVDNCFCEVYINGEFKKIYNLKNVFFTFDSKTQEIKVYLQNEKENFVFYPYYDADNPKSIDYIEAISTTEITIFDINNSEVIGTCKDTKQEIFPGLTIIDGTDLKKLGYNFGTTLSEEDIADVIETLAPKAAAIENQGHYNISGCFTSVIINNELAHFYNLNNLLFTVNPTTGKVTIYLQTKEERSYFYPYYTPGTEHVDYATLEKRTKCTILDINGTCEIGTCNDGQQQELFSTEFVVDGNSLPYYLDGLGEQISPAEFAEIAKILPQSVGVAENRSPSKTLIKKKDDIK